MKDMNLDFDGIIFLIATKILLAIYEFESVAKNQMRLALDTYFKSEREKDELMHIVSLDYIPKNVSCDTVLDCIDIADLVCEKLSRTDEGSGLLHKTSYNGNLEVVIA